MQDFGFSDLRVVNEFTPPFEAAQLEAKSAVGAQHVMRDARQFDQLAPAIQDCTVVVGTTAIGNRELTREVVTLQQAAPGMLAALAQPEQRVALLFGSEKTGLTNEQLSHCQALLTIPLFDPAAAPGADPTTRHLSMNLGQSVAVCLYELTREGLEHARVLPTHAPPAATSGDRERLATRLAEVMQATGYARRFPANSREHVVRHLAARLATTRDEASTWLGLFRMVLRREEEPGTPEA